MLRHGILLFIVAASFAAGSSASAQYYQGHPGYCGPNGQRPQAEGFWARVKTDWRRNNSWPEPFASRDREVYHSHIAATIEKGWQLQHTLGDYHFNSETNQLNRAGEAKVRYILTQAPPERRNIFVMASLAPNTTEMRIDAVQEAAVRYVPQGSLPGVYPTYEEPRPWPADYVDQIERRVDASIPDPRIPFPVPAPDSVQ